MVTKRFKLSYDVVEAARRRVISAFDNGTKVYFSISGGKDSIVLAHVIYTLIREGRIDPKQLIVDFIDEEAIFEDVERIAMQWRKKFLALGVEFRWFCIEVKHFNCFNQLTNDESFICWDSTAQENWVRPMPSFAITDHPMLQRRVETYQSFLHRINRDGISIAGLRVSESVHRLKAFQPDFSGGTLFQPIFDWRDTDVWRFIQEEQLDFPETYMHMYQTGRNRREMRISQFFSIDTAKSLVKMNEYEPGLMDRIIKREPNAYLAALYWDTEMFRSSGGEGEEDRDKDYRKLVFELMEDPVWLETETHRNMVKKIRGAIFKFNTSITAKHWRSMYSMMIAGDPKDRAYRALITSMASSAVKSK